MKTPRCYTSNALQEGRSIELETTSSHHLVNVLRMRAGQEIILFNGQGGEFTARIEEAGKKTLRVQIVDFHEVDRESPLAVTLAQGISRGQKMDFTLQKAVELGVHRIVPVLNERTTLRLRGERRAKKHDHWQHIIVAACEQCGRNRLPEVLPAIGLDDWLARDANAMKLVLDPTATQRLAGMPDPGRALTLLIGSEGGLSVEEIDRAVACGYRRVGLGVRILRTETAAVAALGVCQSLWGDM
jgi:16S rRNA (uracil1498-N3)-methyltransferase